MLRMLEHKNARNDYKRAKELRKQGSIAERLLWNELYKSSKVRKLKFRRQYPLRPYIADFICLRARLVIELDGPSHDMRLGQDVRRDAVMNDEGYIVMRIGNEEVMKNLEGVVTTILGKAEELIMNNPENSSERNAPSPNPSREGRGARSRGGKRIT